MVRRTVTSQAQPCLWNRLQDREWNLASAGLAVAVPPGAHRGQCPLDVDQGLPGAVSDQQRYLANGGLRPGLTVLRARRRSTARTSGELGKLLHAEVPFALQRFTQAWQILVKLVSSLPGARPNAFPFRQHIHRLSVWKCILVDSAN
jgi:hypothetical protein